MKLTKTTKDLFDQLSSLLLCLSNKEYSKNLEVLGGAKIGQHVRHSLELFGCFFDGKELGTIDYDARNRDVFLENNTLEAKALISSFVQKLDSIVENKTVELVNNFATDSEVQQTLSSNVYRELIYNIEHTIHHMALIKIGLRELKPDLVLPESFGVASSTMKYRESK